MTTNDEIDEKIEELDIVMEIEHKNVPYVIAQIRGLINEARAEGYKQGIAHCEKRDNNPIFNWYVKEFLKEEFLNLGKDLALQEPVKVFADKIRLSERTRVIEVLENIGIKYAHTSKDYNSDFYKSFAIDEAITAIKEMGNGVIK
jgi:hypothetical protein